MNRGSEGALRAQLTMLAAALRPEAFDSDIDKRYPGFTGQDRAAIELGIRRERDASTSRELGMLIERFLPQPSKPARGKR